MGKEDEEVVLVAEEEDEVEDSGLHLIRKSKLLNSKTHTDTTNTNAPTIHEPQNGISTKNESENGVNDNGSLPILAHNLPEPEESNGQDQETENNSVYYDKDEGIWKCRFCCWIYQPGSLCIDHIQNAKEHLNIVMSGKMFSRPDQCFNFDIKGGNFISAFSGEESTEEGATIENPVIGSHNGIVDRRPNSGIDYQHGEHTKDISVSASILQPSGVTDNINTVSQETSTIKEIDSADTDLIDESDLDVAAIPLEKVLLENISVSASILQPSGVIDNINTVSQETSSIKEIESTNTDLIDESDLDVAEISLEKVLLKQKTHDLYCPNCNSCITRRVILRKRKRITQPPSVDFKHHKPEAEIEIEAGAGSSEPVSNQDPVSSTAYNSSSIPPEEIYDRDGEPEIFRCLACFSFFIPTGNAFKFGRKSEKSTSQNDQISEPNKNWFSSIFAPNKLRTPHEQGSLGKESEERNKKGAHTPLIIIDTENSLSSIPGRAVSAACVTDGLQGNGYVEPQESALLGIMTTNITYKSQENTVKDDQVDNGKGTFLYQKFDEAVTIGNVTLSNGECAAAGDLETRLDDLETRLDGIDLIISSDRGPELLGRSPADPKYDMESKKSPDDEAMINNLVTNTKEYTAVDILREKPTESLHDTINVRDTNRDKETVVTIATGTEVTIVTIGAGTEVASQITEEAIVSSQQVTSQLSGQASVVELRASEAGESYGIEIIKSIVYGGLVESITSLSVVSSAVGGGAATLHTVALGLANVIGGIFIICHNLYQLKNDEVDDAINQVTEKNDKYREILGKRKNFVLHAFVAILSYLIFGLLSPIVFGFSFRKSDDRELKLAVVAAASFMCILVLAVAKAYVQTPPKRYVGTVLRYLSLGFMVSGVSYVAGELFEMLLNDLGLFENLSSVPTLSLPVKPPNNRAWASF